MITTSHLDVLMDDLGEELIEIDGAGLRIEDSVRAILAALSLGPQDLRAMGPRARTAIYRAVGHLEVIVSSKESMLTAAADARIALARLRQLRLRVDRYPDAA
jgi:hypothetical protein